MTLCTFQVEPVEGWMLRHHCLLTTLTMHPPARAIGGRPVPRP
jgi:hypothetical protein